MDHPTSPDPSRWAAIDATRPEGVEARAWRRRAVTSGTPSQDLWTPLDDGTMSWLGGDSPDQSGREAGIRVSAPQWRRTLIDCGLEEDLALMGVDFADYPAGEPLSLIIPPGNPLPEASTIAIDTVAAATNLYAERRRSDLFFAQHSSARWRRDPYRVAGFQPSDIGALRSTLLTKELMDQVNYTRSPHLVERRIVAAEVALWAYMASARFIPAHLAGDAATGPAPTPEARDRIRLPAPYVLAFHDGLAMRHVSGGAVQSRGLLIAVLMRADADGRLGTDDAYLITARPSERDEGHEYLATVVSMATDSGASHLVWKYAALLAWEGWTIPPALPGPRDDAAGSARAAKKTARTREAAEGAWHRVHVLTSRPPAPLPDLDTTADTLTGTTAPDDDDAAGRELSYQHRRRDHSRRVRIGIRDEHGRKVGPVTGEGAVLGETYLYREVELPARIVRPDLPERPNIVRRIPGTTQRDTSDHGT